MVNVARGADPTWSMLAVRVCRLSQCLPVWGPTWSMLPVGPRRLGQWLPPGPPDMMHVGRLGCDLVNFARSGDPTWSMMAAEGPPTRSMWTAGGRLDQCCPHGRPDLVNVGRPCRLA